jgi:aryl-alcohol dehydrogenase-like predicted oxidoreductase
MSNRRNFIKTSLTGGAVLTTGSIASAQSSKKPKQVDRRVLGRTGAEVSILGLGLGSAFTGPYQSDIETGHALLHHALDHGINYWDTCRGYGASESMIGPVVEKNRNDIFLVTKSGGRTYDAFMRDVEESLKNLRTDHFDILHMWNIKANEDLDVMEKGAFRAIKQLVDEKVVRNYGITGHSGASILMQAIERFDPATILTVYPCTRDDNGRYEDELLPMARERNMGVIAMKMVRRARNADLRGSDLIRYALSLDGVQSSIVGLDTLAHLNENIDMATNFQPMLGEQRAQLHQDAVRGLRDIPTPWEHPNYVDGSLA